MTARQGREFWSRAVAAAESGSASHDEVATRFGVNVGTLRSWIYRLRREQRINGRPHVRVLPVTVTDPSGSAGVVLRVGDVVLEFARSSDPSYIAAVAVAVRAAAC
jgi:transposase-like protein